MTGMFIAILVFGIGSIEMAFEQGQANPQAESFISSTSKVLVDGREYGVDVVGD